MLQEDRAKCCGEGRDEMATANVKLRKESCRKERTHRDVKYLYLICKAMGEAITSYFHFLYTTLCFLSDPQSQERKHTVVKYLFLSCKAIIETCLFSTSPFTLSFL